MEKIIRILPAMVNPDGTMSLCLVRKSSNEMGCIEIRAGDIPAENLENAIIEVLSVGLLTEKGSREISIKRLLSTSEDSEYYVAAGNADTFAPLTSHDEDIRWVPQSDFKFGGLPENSPDVRELRGVYTGSLPETDYGAVLMGVQAVRRMRFPDIPEIIGSPRAPLDTVLKNPNFFTLTMEPKIDRQLPVIISRQPLAIIVSETEIFPPDAKRKRGGATRRDVFKWAARLVSVASKISALPVRPAEILAGYAERLALAGGAKPV